MQFARLKTQESSIFFGFHYNSVTFFAKIIANLGETLHQKR